MSPNRGTLSHRIALRCTKVQVQERASGGAHVHSHFESIWHWLTFALANAYRLAWAHAHG
eukprot:9680712-Lingulodinium_polyedra.AAC.1